MYYASRETLGNPHRKTSDWLWGHGKEIEKLLEEKKSKHLRHLQENSKRSKSALAEVQTKVQREVRALKNEGGRGEQKDCRVWLTTIIIVDCLPG